MPGPINTLYDVANWVTGDMLHRQTGTQADFDVQLLALRTAVQVYKTICAAVPFDELRTTTAELNLTANQSVYPLTTFIPNEGSATLATPALRAIANIRITFDPSNKRRLRKSHVRVYDALSITPASRPSTYARWGGNLEFNPPPDSSSYSIRIRYWFRPALVGVNPAAFSNISNAVWNAGVVTITYTNLGGITSTQIQTGSTVTISGVNPAGYNGQFYVTSSNYSYYNNVPTTVVTYNLAANPGAYVNGGQILDSSPYGTTILIPSEWVQLLQWETLYQVYIALNQHDKAMQLMQPPFQQMQQGSPRNQKMYHVGIIPRLWNDLLKTVDQVENVDEDFSINPVIRPYSVR